MTVLAEKDQVQLVNQVPQGASVKAIKYCAPDRERVLTISLDRVAGFDRICFADNGLGIDLEKYGHKLFEMYQTFHSHEDSRGIGLYRTHNQVKSMGVHIEVSSEVNKGKTFWMLLPR